MVSLLLGPNPFITENLYLRLDMHIILSHSEVNMFMLIEIKEF